MNKTTRRDAGALLRYAAEIAEMDGLGGCSAISRAARYACPNRNDWRATIHHNSVVSYAEGFFRRIKPARIRNDGYWWPEPPWPLPTIADTLRQRRAQRAQRARVLGLLFAAEIAEHGEA